MGKYKHIFDTTQVERDLKGKTIRAVVSSTVVEVLTQVLRFGAVIVLARLLLPEHFGLVGMVTSLTVFAERLKHLGLSTATIQKRDITHEQVSTLFWINAGAGVLIALVIVGGSWSIAAFYHEPKLVSISMALALGFVFGGLAVQHDALLRRQLRFSELAGIQFVAALLSSGVAIILAMSGYTYWALVWREVLRPGMELIGVWCICRWWPGLPKWDPALRPLLKGGGNIAGADTVYFVSTSMGGILLGRFSGASDLGLYRQASQLISLPMNQLCYPLGNVALPSMSALHDQPEQYQRYLEKIVGLVFFAAAPLVTCLAMLPSDIVRVVLGAQWIEAVEIFRVLAIGALVEPLITVCSTVMITRRRSDLLLKWTILYCCALVGSYVVGVQWGAFGVACGYAVVNYVCIFPALLISLQGSQISRSLFFKATWKPIVFSLILGLCLFGFLQYAESWQNVERLSVAVLAAILVYSGLWFGHAGGRAKILEDASSFLSALKPGKKSS